MPRGDGLKERVASRLTRIEAAAARRMSRGTGVLATIGSTAPFVGLFGTVWGIMNAFIGISRSADHQPGRGGARHRRGAARHRARPGRGYPGRGHLQCLRALDHRLPADAGRRLGGGRAAGQPRPRFPHPRARAARRGRWRRNSGARHGRQDPRNRRRRSRGEPRDQRDAVHRRHAGAADHLHGGGAAGDRRRQCRPAGLDRRRGSRGPTSRCS